tara:strand:+ start:3209 stop:5008 length:1800 start_codon:yes stop_codon:yes gene_type:complete
MAINFLNTVDLNRNQLNFAAIQNLPNDPGTGSVEGQIYYNTGTYLLRVYSNSSWTNVGSGTVTSVATTHEGNAFTATIGGDASINPSVDISMAGATTEYINGKGNLVTFPTIPQGDITKIIPGTYLNGGGDTGDITLNHDLTARTDTTSATSATPFTVIDTITLNTTGHVTAVNTKTVTLINSDTTYTIDTAANGTVTLDDSRAGVTDTTVQFIGTANEIETSITTGAAGIVKIGFPIAGFTAPDGSIATTQGNNNNSEKLATTAYVDSMIGTIPSGLAFEGTWDASTGNPPSATPVNGQFWIVSVDGNTNLSGITDWKVGDWAIYVATGAGTDGWQKVDNTSTLSGSGVAAQVTFWSGAAALTGDAGMTYNSGTNTLTVGAIDTTADGTSANWAEAYNNYVASAAVTGTTTKTMTFTQRDGGTFTADWTDNDAVTSVGPSTVGSKLGISVTPSTGDVKVGLDISGLAAVGTPLEDADELPISDNSETENRKVTIGQLETHLGGKNSASFVLNATSTNVDDQGTPPTGTIGWVIDVDAALDGATAIQCTIEIIEKESSGGRTVYTDIARATKYITANFVTTVANPVAAGDYIALVTKMY